MVFLGYHATAQTDDNVPCALLPYEVFITTYDRLEPTRSASIKDMGHIPFSDGCAWVLRSLFDRNGRVGMMDEQVVSCLPPEVVGRDRIARRTNLGVQPEYPPSPVKQCQRHAALTRDARCSRRRLRVRVPATARDRRAGCRGRRRPARPGAW